MSSIDKRLDDLVVVDEDGLPIEDVDFGRGHLGVNAEHHAQLLHFSQRRVGFPDVGDASFGIGGGSGGVYLQALI